LDRFWDYWSTRSTDHEVRYARDFQSVGCQSRRDAISAFTGALELGVAPFRVYPTKTGIRCTASQAGRVLPDRESATRCAPTCRSAKSSTPPAVPAHDAVVPRIRVSGRKPRAGPPRLRNAGNHIRRPQHEVLELNRNKSVRSRLRSEAGLPVLSRRRRSEFSRRDRIRRSRHAIPLFVKEVAGGGGRGMRGSADVAALPEAIEAAEPRSRSRRSGIDGSTRAGRDSKPHANRGPDPWPTQQGKRDHLYERDCSVRGRATRKSSSWPRPEPGRGVRDRSAPDALAFAATSVTAARAGTVSSCSTSVGITPSSR